MKQLKLKDLLYITLFYLFFSYIYRIVLWWNSGSYQDDGFWGWIDLKGYWYTAGMQYSFYLIASLLIWFIGVWLLRHQKTKVQILVVTLLIPVTVYFVRELRYELIDYLGRGRLRGAGEIWDWYIPTLFMMVQFGLYFAYKYFLDNQRKLIVEGELRQAALKSELSAIKAQLNPHFLYNIFNTISASVPAENEKTRHLIAELADLFRYQLKASKTDKVTLREELEFVNKYLALEKERFQERLTVTVNVDDSILDEKIPPMLLQPLVENSIKHGLSSLVEGGSITITIQKKDNRLAFEIADTGVGVKDKKRVFDRGIGLTNTKLRLEKMYETSLELSDNVPQGLKINFSI